MIKQIYNPAGEPLKVVAVCSGPGNTVWQALDLQREMAADGGSPFEIVGLFSDRPLSRALEEAERQGLNKYLLEASAFHRGEPGELMSSQDSQAFEEAMIDLLRPAGADCLLVDGYQWTIGSRLLEKYAAIRVWPGGPACLKNFLKTGQKALRAKVTFLTAPGGLGPVMLTAPPVEIDYDKFDDEKSALTLYLPQVMEQSGRAGARAVLEISRGNFGLDEAGGLYFQGRAVPDSLSFDRWE